MSGGGSIEFVYNIPNTGTVGVKVFIQARSGTTYTIDWGDGNTNSPTGDNSLQTITYSYVNNTSASVPYTVIITNNTPGTGIVWFCTYDGTDTGNQYITEITDLSLNTLLSLNNGFRGATSLTTLPNSASTIPYVDPNVAGEIEQSGPGYGQCVYDMTSCFQGCVSLGNSLANMSNWNMTYVAFLNNTFNGAINFNGTINTWQFTQSGFEYITVADSSTLAFTYGAYVENMLEDANAFNQDLSNWQIANTGTDLGQMTTNCNSWTSINISKSIVGWAAKIDNDNNIPGLPFGMTTTNGYYAFAKNSVEALGSNGTHAIWTINSAQVPITSSIQFTLTLIPFSSAVSFIAYTNNSEGGIQINWGDGLSTDFYPYYSSTTESSSGSGLYAFADLTHTYIDSGTYTISITNTTGVLVSLSVASGVDYITSIESLSLNTLQTINFYGASALTKVPSGADNIGVTNTLTNLTNMFNGASSFTGDAYTTTLGSDGFYTLSSLPTNASIGDWPIQNVTTMSNMFNNSGLTSSNYDAILNGWALKATSPGVQPNVDFSAGTVQYTSGALNAHNTLSDSTNNWIITDGGMLCYVKGTRILCCNMLSENNDDSAANYTFVQRKIENLNAGDWVMTYKHGPVKVKKVWHNTFHNHSGASDTMAVYRLKENVVNMTQEGQPPARLICWNDGEQQQQQQRLTVSGAHAVLVHSLTQDEKERMKVHWGSDKYVRKIDGKYLLLACCAPEFFERANDVKEVEYYHLLLENDGDIYKAYGVYADGVLAETFDEHTMNTIGLKLDDGIAMEAAQRAAAEAVAAAQAKAAANKRPMIGERDDCKKAPVKNTMNTGFFDKARKTKVVSHGY